MNVDTFENIIFNLISCLKNSWWQIIDMKIKHLCSCLTHLSRHRRRRRPKIRVIKARLSHPETKQQDQLTQQETEEVLTWGGGGGGVPVCMWLWDEPAGSTLERHPVTVTVLSSSPVSVQMELDVPKPGFNFSWSGFSQTTVLDAGTFRCTVVHLCQGFTIILYIHNTLYLFTAVVKGTV